MRMRERTSDLIRGIKKSKKATYVEKSVSKE